MYRLSLATFLTLAALPGFASAQVPSNDTCATPLVISGTGAFPYERTEATESGFGAGGSAACLSVASAPYDLFWAWTVPADGSYVLDICDDTGGDTILFVHDGSDCAATCRIANEFGSISFCTGFSYNGRIVLPDLVAGEALLIQAGDFNPSPPGTTLTGTLTIAPTVTPSNDDCSAPTPIVGAGSFSYDATGAGNSQFFGGNPVACGGNSLSPEGDVFFVWTPTSSGEHLLTVPCVTNQSWELTVHEGSDCSATCLAYGGSSCSDPYVVAPNLTAGDSYLIQAGSSDHWAHVPGPSVFDILEPGPQPPIHSDCEVPAVLEEGVLTHWTNEFADSSGLSITCPIGFPNPNVPADVHHDVFFTFQAPCDGTYQLWTRAITASETTTVVRSHCNGACLAFDGDDGAGSANSDNLFTFDLVGNQTISIQVGTQVDRSGQGWGTIELTRVSPPCPPAGDMEISCDALPHSQGGPVTLADSGFYAEDAPHLRVLAKQGPPDEFGFFVISADGSADVTVFSGRLCLGGTIGRYNLKVADNQGLLQLDSIGMFNDQGNFRSLTGNSDNGAGFQLPYELPFTPPGMMLMPGDTWYVQLWYRDDLPGGGSTANFSDMLRVTLP